MRPRGHCRLGQRLGFDRLCIGEDAGRTNRQKATGLGQRQAPRGAVEQALAKPTLQTGNRL